MFRRVRECRRLASRRRESDIVRGFISVDLLVIDEAGIPYSSEEERGLINDVLDGRYERKKPLIITSSKEYHGLSDMIGPHNVDRFQDKESESSIRIFDWQSYRSGRKV